MLGKIDPSDDWSHQDLRIEEDNWKGTPAKTDYICVYDDGVLVGGIEPDGTTPEDNNPTPTPTPTPTVSDTVVGDVTGDGEVDSIDFAYFRMYLLGNLKDFPVEDDLTAGDVNGDGEVDSIDFAYLRMYLLGNIKDFPASK